MPAIGTNIKSSKVDVSKSKYADSDLSVLSDSLLEMSLDGWDGIALEYSIDWPLQLFFTQEVLSRYVCLQLLHIFSFLNSSCP